MQGILMKSSSINFKFGYPPELFPLELQNHQSNIN